jgi:hypothetical protein
MTATRHWAEPSAPDLADEARYRRAVASGLSEAEFEALEAAADAAVDARLAESAAAATADRARWEAIYRAAVCAAAEAIRAVNWGAKRQALAVAEQADRGRCIMRTSLFGTAESIPAQYAGLEAAGRSITREESSAALQAVAADRRAQQQIRARPARR